MEWVQSLRSFVSAVQLGSLSSASRTLGCSPASVSRHISSLEDQLGTQLLKRSSRKIALTEAGGLYYNQVEQVLAQLLEANRSISQIYTKPQGMLRVHSRLLLGHMMIVPRLPEFLKRYPDITIDLMMSNSIAPVMDESVDVDIRVAALEDPTVVSHKLAASERFIVGTPDYLKTHPPIHVPEDLRQHNCFTFRINLGVPVWRFMDSDKRVIEVPIKGSFQTDFGFALVELVRAGAGIALLPDWAVRDDLADGRLISIFPNYRVSHVDFDNDVYAIYPKSRQTSARLRLFVDFMSKVFHNGRD